MHCAAFERAGKGERGPTPPLRASQVPSGQARYVGPVLFALVAVAWSPGPHHRLFSLSPSGRLPYRRSSLRQSICRHVWGPLVLNRPTSRLLHRYSETYDVFQGALAFGMSPGPGGQSRVMARYSSTHISCCSRAYELALKTSRSGLPAFHSMWRNTSLVKHLARRHVHKFGVHARGARGPMCEYIIHDASPMQTVVHSFMLPAPPCHSSMARLSPLQTWAQV